MRCSALVRSGCVPSVSNERITHRLYGKVQKGKQCDLYRTLYVGGATASLNRGDDTLDRLRLSICNLGVRIDSCGGACRWHVGLGDVCEYITYEPTEPNGENSDLRARTNERYKQMDDLTSSP